MYRHIECYTLYPNPSSHNLFFITLSDEQAEAPKADETSVPQESDEKEESEEFKHEHGEDRLMEEIEREELPRPRQDSQTLQIRQHHPYIEHKITYEGGTITVMGVHLLIPDEALSSDHVIAVTVIHDPEKHLPGSSRRGRMTPLIKLEPEGIKLNKPALLTIPHSAIIPEPDHHSVVVFTGQTDQGDLHKGKYGTKDLYHFLAISKVPD